MIIQGVSLHTLFFTTLKNSFLFVQSNSEKNEMFHSEIMSLGLRILIYTLYEDGGTLFCGDVKFSLFILGIQGYCSQKGEMTKTP